MTSKETHHKPCGLPTTESTKSFWHSEPSPLLQGHRTTRELPEKADIVIIGSGITGTSIADHLLRTTGHDRKLNVVLLEAREACWGATGRNGGHCQPLLFEHPDDPSIGIFEFQNYSLLAHLVNARGIDCEFASQPSIRAIYDEALLKQAQQALAVVRETAPDLASMMHIITSKEELARFRIPSATGAMYTSHAARLWPYKLVTHFLEELLRATDLNGTFNLQTLTPVDSIEQYDSRWLVKTARGCVDAGTVFLATNGYTSHLLHDFADLIIPCRGQMSALIPGSSLSGKRRIPTSMGFEGHGMDDYLIQRSGISGEQLMFGGGRLLGPSIGITDDSTIDDNVAMYLRTALPQHMDLQDEDSTTEFKATHQWTGIMGWSKDGLPWVGRVPNRHNLYISAGYTGHGMPNAWLCGKALTDMFFASHRSHDEAVEVAQKATGLPSAYLVTGDRIRKASQQIAQCHEPSGIARDATDVRQQQR